VTPQSSTPGQPRRRRLTFVAAAAGLSTAFALLLAGCSSITGPISPTPAAPAPAQATSPATVAPSAGSAPTGSSAPSTSEASTAIQAVITKANQEQASALARNDATIMKDTATSQYYATLVQTQQDLQSQGVASIKLVDIQWGKISATGSTGEAETTETWQSTFSDGTSEQDTERNVYALVQQGGTWFISNDAQVGSSGGSTTRPANAAGVSESSNWSGYSATGGSFTAVSGTWTVPQVKADSSAGSADATWIGVGGVTNDDLIQAGTEATVNGAGQVTYSAWVELLPQPPQDVRLTVRPGDVVSASISQQSTGTWRISIVDQTTQQSYQTTVQYQSSLSSVEWIEEAPSIVSGRAHVLTLDDFGTVSFEGATATLNGQQVTLATAKSKPINMYDRSGTITTTSTAGSDGSSFTVTRVASRA
jgi:Peptidase A4 family